MDLWNKYKVTVNDREWIHCKLLDVVIGKELPNKYRKLESMVQEIVAGTPFTVTDVFRKKLETTPGANVSLVMAARIMQLLLLRGLKEMPWNETRRSLVTMFFTSAVIPDAEPGPFRSGYLGNAAGPVPAPAPTAPAPPAPAPPAPAPTAPAPTTPAPTTRAPTGWQVSQAILPAIIPRSRDRTESNFNRNVKRWKTKTGALQFWRQVFLFVKNNELNLEGMVLFLRKNLGKRVNYAKILVNALLVKRGGMRNFCDHLAIAMKTGNMETLVNVIRDHIDVKGLHCNIVPSIRNIKLSTANLVHHFIALCQPERTYSGFRADIVAAVRLIAFLLLKKTDISGLEVSTRQFIHILIITMQVNICSIPECKTMVDILHIAAFPRCMNTLVIINVVSAAFPRYNTLIHIAEFPTYMTTDNSHITTHDTRCTRSTPADVKMQHSRVSKP